MVLFQLAVSMQKNANRCFPISLYKVEIQVDQISPHKTRYSKTNRTESEQEIRTYRHKENFSEKNINGLCSKIMNQQMEPHKTAKSL